MRRLFATVLWVEVALRLVAALAVLLVPEWLVGRVVASDLRWILASGSVGMAALAWTAVRCRDAGALRSHAGALLAAELVQLVGAALAFVDRPQQWAHLAVGGLFAANLLLGLTRAPLPESASR